MDKKNLAKVAALSVAALSGNASAQANKELPDIVKKAAYQGGQASLGVGTLKLKGSLNAHSTRHSSNGYTEAQKAQKIVIKKAQSENLKAFKDAEKELKNKVGAVSMPQLLKRRSHTQDHATASDTIHTSSVRYIDAGLKVKNPKSSPRPYV